ncbi:MAG: hypothetical protein Q7S74_05095 [Nanoarchaeota archaeon]|nr:hypothetical protein [Nanoarchaeota archaeon]
MQEKLLKDIVKEISGQNSEKLVDILYGKKNVNEFLIANKLVMTINQTRNILYKLGEEGLVRFIRKKDKKKGGWYTYFWTLDIEKSLIKYRERIDKKIDQLSSQLNIRQTKSFFYCKNCDIEYTEEIALANNYTCPECGEVLDVKQPEEVVPYIKEEIKKMENTKAILNSEIEEIQQKEQKIKERRIKADMKKKDKDKKFARAKRMKESKKAKNSIKVTKVKNKKAVKEKSKKKVTIKKKKISNKKIKKKRK